MLIILFCLSALVGVFFTQVVSPMFMAGSVLFMAALVVVGLFWVVSSAWFSYVVLLTFLGGMMVLFIYVASLAPNEPKLNLNFWGFLLMQLPLLGVVWWESAADGILGFALNHTTSGLYSAGSAGLVLFLIGLLLFILLVAADITQITSGPMKTM